MSGRKAEKPLVYIVEDEAKLLEIIRINLSNRYNILCFPDAERALDELGRRPPELIVTDVRLPGIDGIAFMERVRRLDMAMPFIVFTGYGSIWHAVETMKKGAFDYLVKPIKIENLVRSIDRALSYAAVTKISLDSEEVLRASVAGAVQEFITRDPATEQVLHLAQKAAGSDAPVLITGETGTGKDLVAHYIHQKSGRKGPFVQLNCASIPRDIIDGELFGYKKGSFTGAVQDYDGKIAASHGGTLFLDEIAELPLAVQAKLLNVLEVPEYYPIGSNVKKKIDLRLVAATNRNLRKMVDGGEFRHDLYYRVAVIPVGIPPLRERKCDILPIADHFLAPKRPACALSPEAKLSLLGHDWPGNVRELKNVIERSFLLLESGNVLERILFDIPERPAAAGDTPIAGAPKPLSIPSTWEEFKILKSTAVKGRKEELEKLFIEQLLLKHDGNVSRSAKSAGMDRRQLQEMIRTLGVDSSIFRSRREKRARHH